MSARIKVVREYYADAISTKPRPSLFFPAARAKHDAWLAQGIRYRGQEDAAREHYLGIASGLGWKADEHEDNDEIDWDEEDTKPVAGGGLGTAVSSIRAADSRCVTA